MYQCPSEYCCENKCTSFNQCSSHRTGLLCGSCEQDHSLSLLSSECLHKSSCDNHWLWLMVILAVVLYMSWYTFKDDVFAIFTWFTRIVFKSFSTHSGQTNIDKGYFGIVTYFVQIKALLVLSKVENTTRTSEIIFLEIESYIDLVLNFELKYFSNNNCALKNMTTTKKTLFQFIFFCGIYFLWNSFFLSISLLENFTKALHWKMLTFEKVKAKLISGLIEVIKYTYVGLASTKFYSLVCTSVAGKNVWFSSVLQQMANNNDSVWSDICSPISTPVLHWYETDNEEKNIKTQFPGSMHISFATSCLLAISCCKKTIQ